MKRFTFDAICFASVTVQAEDENAARRIAENALETVTLSDPPPIEGLEEMSVGYNSEDSIELQDSEEL
jgi:hypothetical protein